MADEGMSIRQRLDALDRRLGKGATFDRQVRDLILDGVVPWRIALGCRVLKGEALKVYQKALTRLVELEKLHGREIDGLPAEAGDDDE